jgi:hypothetical protein
LYYNYISHIAAPLALKLYNTAQFMITYPGAHIVWNPKHLQRAILYMTLNYKKGKKSTGNKFGYWHA